MKTAAIAFATLLALSGAAFAGEPAQKPRDVNASGTHQQTLDPATTGSIQADKKDDVKKPRLGYDIDPFMPTFN